ncbi:hypothetical protein FB45DRAFT_9710 [Roridomyces roridus]|uniref:Arrestin-like N-terminal domain-containing protein n=1 Tax=Roridomyces roridus TaxID=1738132 RepID=A0AAD7CIR3_9AGAR|nr:hypothetical protein FB45DRAFT_9710 [Roridomyces roridus]
MAGDEELPAYTSRDAAAPPPSTTRSEHKLSLETNGRAWLFIYVSSRSPNPASSPYFLEGDTVSGRVEIDLVKAEGLKGISIAIQGGATAVGQEEKVFLELKQGLWPNEKEKGGKLAKGSWPFSFTLPTKVSPPDAKGMELQLPPSFSERASPAYIDYKIIATVQRGTFKANQTLVTSFAYLPITQSDRPSALRQVAYQEGSDLVGPDGDPEGWKVLPPVQMKGKLFDVRDVVVECTLAIATPLTYSLGAPIPLLLTLKSEDPQALDTLANPQAIKMHLVRSIALGTDAMEERAERRSNTFFTMGVGQAYFWPSLEGAPQSGTRVLRGEVEVKKSLRPSFLFPRFSVRYTLELLPFDVAGYVDTNSKKSFISEPVKITTKQVPGIVPKSHAPPGYAKPAENDYNSAVGYLENGNQRFYHHHGFS